MPELRIISEVSNPVLDVVFVHGMTGDSVLTWSSDAGFWPKWISEDNPSVQVSSVQYSYPISPFKRSSLTIHDHATAMMELFMVNGIGTRPLVIIAHSLGGLVVKEVLMRSSQSEASDYRGIWEHTVASIFLSTPVNLSGFNSMFKWFIWPLNNPLRNEDEQALLKINEWYRLEAPRKGITTLSFAAAGDKFAPDADPGVPNAVVIPIDATHVDICKPRSRSALIVASVQHLVANLLKLAEENRLSLGQ